ncbi:50S ribosomal protein L29 [Chloroflexota bacterium]
MKVKEIRALDSAELTKQLEAAHKELFDLRFRLAVKKLVNHREVPRIKREIARLKTIIRERELNIEHPETAKASRKTH